MTVCTRRNKDGGHLTSILHWGSSHVINLAFLIAPETSNRSDDQQGLEFLNVISRSIIRHDQAVDLVANNYIDVQRTPSNVRMTQQDATITTTKLIALFTPPPKISRRHVTKPPKTHHLTNLAFATLQRQRALSHSSNEPKHKNKGIKIYIIQHNESRTASVPFHVVHL